MTFKVGDRLVLNDYGRFKVVNSIFVPTDATFTVTKTYGTMVIVTYDNGVTTLAFGEPRRFFQLAEPEKLLSYEEML